MRLASKQDLCEQWESQPVIVLDGPWSQQAGVDYGVAALLLGVSLPPENSDGSSPQVCSETVLAHAQLRALVVSREVSSEWQQSPEFCCSLEPVVAALLRVVSSPPWNSGASVLEVCSKTTLCHDQLGTLVVSQEVSAKWH